MLLSCVLAAYGPWSSTRPAHAAQETAPPVNNTQAVFDAIDRGNGRYLASYTNFVKTFQSINPDLITNGKLNFNFRDQEGNTPLIHAARQKNLDIVQFLINNGADINAVNNNNESALLTSYLYQQYDISNYLLSTGASDSYHIAQLLQGGLAPAAQDIQVAAARTAPVPAATIPSQPAPVVMAQNQPLPSTVEGEIQPKHSTQDLGNLSPSAGGIGVVAAAGESGFISSNLYLIGGGILAAAGAGGVAAAGSFSSTPALFVPPPLPLSDPPPQYVNPNAFTTSEAQAQEGILAMNVQYALARGYDGSIYSRAMDGSLLSPTPIGNVKVAVVDSGVQLDHPDLVGNILANLAVTCNDLGCVSGGNDTVGHGTEVAGIIAATMNGTGIYGVASKAKIIPVGFADNLGALTHGDAPGIKWALDHGAQVLNGSYGIPALYASQADAAAVTAIQTMLNTNYGGTNLMTEYQHGVTNHAIFVYAAGNESTAGHPVGQPVAPAGLPYYFRGGSVPAGVDATKYAAINPNGYDWSENWIVAVSVYKDSNSTYKISDFSNQCGALMNICLSAPGQITKSTAVGGGYSGAIQGTSFSAPNVAGAVAVLLGAFPQLSPERVVRILFDTATDLGPTGVDPIYGHGLINLQKATDPSDSGWQLGAVTVPVPFAFSTSVISLSVPFGNALFSNHANLMFLDHYGKNYTIPFSAVSGNLTQTKTAYEKLTNLATADMNNTIHLGGSSMFSFSTDAGQKDSKNTFSSKMSKFSYFSEVPLDATGNRTASFTFNYRTNLANALSPTEHRAIVSDALKNPYLALIDTSSSSVINIQNGHTKVTTAAYAGQYNRDEYNYRFKGQKKVTGVYSEVTYAKDKSSLSFDGGMTVENKSLLGSETSGAFAVDKAATYYTGISGKYAFRDNAALVANYNIGYTDVSAADYSFLGGFSGIVSSSFAAGSEFYNIAGEHDTLGFIVSQPLRVNQGNAALTLPVSIANDGTIQSQSSKLNLTPTGHEMDLETFYNLKQGDDSELSLNGIFRLNPDNTSAKNEALFLAKYKITM